jgi:hypothetical protein
MEATEVLEAPTMRYTVITWEELDGIPTTEWEGPTPLAELAVTPTDYYSTQLDYGDHPVADGLDVDEMRRIRELYISGSLGDFGYQFLPITDDGIQYLVFVRDTLPFEDERGLVRAPGFD